LSHFSDDSDDELFNPFSWRIGAKPREKVTSKLELVEVPVVVLVDHDEGSESPSIVLECNSPRRSFSPPRTPKIPSCELIQSKSMIDVSPFHKLQKENTPFKTKEDVVSITSGTSRSTNSSSEIISHIMPQKKKRSKEAPSSIVQVSFAPPADGKVPLRPISMRNCHALIPRRFISKTGLEPDIRKAFAEYEIRL